VSLWTKCRTPSTSGWPARANRRPGCLDRRRYAAARLSCPQQPGQAIPQVSREALDRQGRLSVGEDRSRGDRRYLVGPVRRASEQGRAAGRADDARERRSLAAQADRGQGLGQAGAGEEVQHRIGHQLFQLPQVSSGIARGRRRPSDCGAVPLDRGRRGLFFERGSRGTRADQGVPGGLPQKRPIPTHQTRSSTVAPNYPDRATADRSAAPPAPAPESSCRFREPAPYPD
jgi:hypothetical protein